MLLRGNAKKITDSIRYWHLVAAIVLWAYVLGRLILSSSTVVRNVPINFINEEALEEEGLALLGSSDDCQYIYPTANSNH